MNTAEINRVSGRNFKALLPPHWVVRDQEDQEDYGVDFEIELHTSDDKPTGIIFKAQLKGTERASINAAGELIFSRADVRRFTYYIEQLPVPVVFFVYDITRDACYWEQIQGNHRLVQTFTAARAAGQKTFTICVPPTRTLSRSTQSHDAVIAAVVSAQQALVLRDLHAIPTDIVRDHFRHRDNAASTRDRLRLYAGIADLEAIQDLVNQGRFDLACDKAVALLESETESPETRLQAGLRLSSILPRRYAAEKRPETPTLAANARVHIASQLIRIVRSRRVPRATRTYVLLFARAARIGLNGNGALGLAISEKTLEQQRTSIAAPITRLQRMQAYAVVSRDFRRYQSRLIQCATNNHFAVIPHAVADLMEAILPYVTALGITDQESLADVCIATLSKYVPFCAEVIAAYPSRTDRLEVMNMLATRFVLLAGVRSTSTAHVLADRFLEAISTTPPLDCTEEVKAGLRSVLLTLAAEGRRTAEPTLEELRNMYIQQAAALGIPLHDESDEVAGIIRIGLADLDPSRILRKCEHICVVCTSCGFPAEMLGLPTAGFKRVLCLKHGHYVEAAMLDSAYESFAKANDRDPAAICCDNCADKKPRPNEWQATADWPRQQQVIYEATNMLKGDGDQHQDNVSRQ
ncbi:MAG: DUF4365 domain-containing protein [Planctomycetia bacterium]|jgi:hypothetical protein